MPTRTRTRADRGARAGGRGPRPARRVAVLLLCLSLGLLPGCATIPGTLLGPITMPLDLTLNSGASPSEMVLLFPLNLLTAPLGLLFGLNAGLQADFGLLCHGEYFAVIEEVRSSDGELLGVRRELPYRAIFAPVNGAIYWSMIHDVDAPLPPVYRLAAGPRDP